jgi:broad specificity phosphatase PhoE
MTDLYIFRHGDTTETDKWWLKFIGRNYNSHNIKILPKARVALERIGSFLKGVKTDADFTSPYIRCIESSDIVGRISNKKYTVDKRIQELEREYRDLVGFNKRVTSFFNEIVGKNYSAISICTHGAVMGALKHLVIEGRFHRFQIWDYPAPGNLIIIKDGKVEKINFNR